MSTTVSVCKRVKIIVYPLFIPLIPGTFLLQLNSRVHILIGLRFKRPMSKESDIVIYGSKLILTSRRLLKNNFSKRSKVVGLQP